MWNRFEADRKYLNLYDNPSFEQGSGIMEYGEFLAGMKETFHLHKNKPHPIVKAKVIEFIADNAAIEVNPKDWFGFNFFGWFTPNSAQKVFEKYKGTDPYLVKFNDPYYVQRPLRYVVEQWIAEIPRTEAYKKADYKFRETGAGITSYDYDHSVPDWDSVLRLGFSGILKRAECFHETHRRNGTLTQEMDVYYESVEISYRAILRLLNRFLNCAQKHINEDAKMPIVVEGLKSLINGAPDSLYQFLLLEYFYHLIQENLDVVQVRSLGNVDVEGYKYYKKDIEKGDLTKENAIELTQYFFEKYANQAHKFAQPLYFGGFDEKGESLINEYSYVMIEAYDRSCIVSPKLFVKVMPNTPDAFLKRVLAMIRDGNNAVVFVNEEIGMKISEKLGRSEAETKRLVATGCNNFASRGNESTPEHVYVNLAKGIELAFNNGTDPLTKEKIGIETGDVSEFKTFEQFKNAYIAQTEHLIRKAFVISDFIDENLLYMNPTPIFSGSMECSVKCGKDAYFNGAKYPNTVMFLSCHATVADCLMMVKKYVYDLKKYSIEQVRDALLADYVGYEEMHETFKNDEEKYGNDMDSADNMLKDVCEHFAGIVNGRKNRRGGVFRVNGESIINAHQWAQKCGATPDGRKRGDLLSKNMSASMGADKKGITAHINSATKIDATAFPYGCPFDYLLHPSMTVGEKGLDAMLGLLRTFMKRGGYAYQGSVQDAKVLKDAQVHPEKYPNLQVRIAGWSWYFTKMDKEYQDEFIRRAELLEV